MTKHEELKACPFCDKNDGFKFAISDFDDYILVNVVCSCGARGPTGESKNEAIGHWNTRRG